MTNEEKIKILKENLEIFSTRQETIKKQKSLTINEITELLSNDTNCLEKMSECFSDEQLNLSPEDKIFFCRKI